MFLETYDGLLNPYPAPAEYREIQQVSPYPAP